MQFIRIISISLMGLLGTEATFADDHILGDDSDMMGFEESGLGGSGFDLPAFDSNLVPVVLTATRIQQHQSDVPASVTILDSEFIQNLGTNNLAEVLRYVPGIMMGPDKNNNVDSLNYHGGESSLPKNLQVLVDGRSMYRAGLASVSWYEMPVAIADIDRIEVVRGPNSASYGANAYQAVINILTKHPSDTYGTTLSFEAGENGQEDVFLRQGGRIDETDYRVSYTQKNDDGFSNSNDTRHSHFLNVDSYKHLGAAGELELSLVMSDSTRNLRDKLQVDGVDIQTNDNKVDETRSEIGIQWTKDFSSKHQLLIKSYLTYFEQKQLIKVENIPNYLLDTDLLNLNNINSENADNLITATAAAIGASDLSIVLAYIATLPVDQQGLATNFATTYSTGGIGNVAGDINADLAEFRFDIELQDTYIHSSALTFVSGVSFRRDVVDSDHYFDGELYSNTSRMFGSITWKPNDQTNLHLGGMIEKEEFSDTVFSPRAAINYKISPSESLRYVYSESVRSPDFFEQFANWTLEVENAAPSSLLNGNIYYQVGRGPGMIEHQKIVSNELGYYGRLNDYAAELDVRLFHEAESQVLYQSLSVDDFIAENDNTIDHFGIEWQVQVNPFSNTLLRMTAAYVEVDTSREDNGAKLRVYAKETATATWMQGWGSRVSTTLNYFIVKDLDDTNVNSNRSRIERIDGRISKGLNLASIDADIYMNFQHDISSDTYLWDSTYYTDSTRLVLGASVAF
jgi:iron complex outermembrane receptor protein